MARCERCGADLPERARFCPSCGAPAEPAAPTAAERKLATVVFEEEATPLLELHGTYIVPFAQRALGRVRGDRALVESALARFEELGLRWHAEETRTVLAR